MQVILKCDTDVLLGILKTVVPESRQRNLVSVIVLLIIAKVHLYSEVLWWMRVIKVHDA